MNEENVAESGAPAGGEPPEEGRAGRRRPSAGGGAPVPGAAAAAPAGPEAAESAVLRDRWLRAEADLQNFRRRAARELEEARRGAEESVMLDIIGALDDLDRALDAAREDGAPEAWTEGVRLVASRLQEDLARRGVVPLDPEGQPFDPAYHEAILELESDQMEPGQVVKSVLRGWRRGERALRPARVVVARARAGD